ncbi:hypothetical protein C8Q70DRAFT_620697 [Cubamyces menziesii]|nr:hypothetical protein C8Q70DRAFT_620697 [Cubamyces menziesii]
MHAVLRALCCATPSSLAHCPLCSTNHLSACSARCLCVSHFVFLSPLRPPTRPPCVSQYLSISPRWPPRVLHPPTLHRQPSTPGTWSRRPAGTHTNHHYYRYHRRYRVNFFQNVPCPYFGPRCRHCCARAHPSATYPSRVCLAPLIHSVRNSTLRRRARLVVPPKRETRTARTRPLYVVQSIRARPLLRFTFLHPYSYPFSHCSRLPAFPTHQRFDRALLRRAS